MPDGEHTITAQPDGEPHAGRAADADAELVERAKRGSRDAFRVLVERHHRGVTGFVRRSLAEPADVEDVTQDVFLQAWAGLARHDPRWRFSTWLYTIAARRTIGSLRARERRATADVDALPVAAATPDPAELVERNEQARALWALADQLLPPDQRTALWLRYAEDLDTAEIARVLERSSVAVRLLLFRARRRLAAAVADPPPAASIPSSSRAESAPAAPSASIPSATPTASRRRDRR